MPCLLHRGCRLSMNSENKHMNVLFTLETSRNSKNWKWNFLEFGRSCWVSLLHDFGQFAKQKFISLAVFAETGGISSLCSTKGIWKLYKYFGFINICLYSYAFSINNLMDLKFFFLRESESLESNHCAAC